MMAGGIAALLLQMLHPGALGGVWDYSDVHDDMLSLVSYDRFPTYNFLATPRLLRKTYNTRLT